MIRRLSFKQFLFLVPLFVFLGIFSVYPIVTSVLYSFFDYKTNNQQLNGFYMSEQLNETLFAEDCGYISYFIASDKTIEGLSDEDVAEFEAIAAEVEEMQTQYADATGTVKVSSSEMEEVEAFIADISERLTTVYENNADLEFYNAENIQTILAEMETCIVESNFHGLSGYATLLQDSRFWKALGHTAVFTVISVACELVLGLALAMIMNMAIKGIGIVRTTGLIPWAIPTAVSATIWGFLYDGSYGVVSKIFTVLHIIPKQSAMLLTSNGAMASAIIADVWKTTPYMALLLLAGLQVIDKSLYESAALDGATPVQTFFRITMPLLKPSLVVALLFRTMDGFRVYDLIAILTGGGPANGTETLSVYAYKLMFSQSNYGYGSVVVIAMAICIFLIALAFIKLLGAQLISNED